jgi:hypothetical protein
VPRVDPDVMVAERPGGDHCLVMSNYLDIFWDDLQHGNAKQSIAKYNTAQHSTCKPSRVFVGDGIRVSRFFFFLSRVFGYD